MRNKIKMLRNGLLLTACTLCININARSQNIYTIAGIGSGGYTGDGAAATLAKLDRPMGMAFDAIGNIYYADSGSHVIRKVDVSSNIISTIAGTGVAGTSGDGSSATSATLNGPTGIAIDASGNIYITEALGHVVRKINTSGVISTIAGTGTASTSGDGSSATAATLNTPMGIAIDASNNIYIAEADGNVIRKINSSGIISTIAGTGTGSSSGDGSSATAATINGPTSITFDASGNLYIAESKAHKIRKINSLGVISTFAGTGSAGSSGDGGLATDAQLRMPTGLVFDKDGNLFIAESNGRYIRKVSNTYTISTIAGTGVAGYSGDGNDAILATFRRPSNIAFNRGNLFISDFNTRTIRMICNPEMPIVSDTILSCKDATLAALTANGTNLLWYADDTTSISSTTAPIPSSTTIGASTYFVSQTSFANTCESPRAQITVIINDLPAAPTTIDSITYCKGVTATALTATGSSLKWYTVASGGSGSTTDPTPSTSTAGITNYYVSQTSSADLGACESPRTKSIVAVKALPTAPTVTAGTINVCVGGSVSLSATGSDLKWYTTSTGGTGTATTPTPSTSSAGTTNYYVSQTSAALDGACESARTSIAVVVNAFPSAPSVSSTINLCQDGPSSALTASGSNLKWYDATTGGTMYSSAPTPNTSSTGTTDFYVSQSLSSTLGGCESSRSKISVIVNSNPTAPSVTTPINLCIGGSTSLLSATGTTIKWYDVATGGVATTIPPTPSVASVSTTYFYATQTSSVGCESPRAAIEVNVKPLPIVGLASTAWTGIIFCEGKTISLEATAPTAISYTWKTDGTTVTGATTDKLDVGTTGITTVEVTDIFGCKSTADLFVQQDTSRKPTLNPSLSKFCSGNSTIITCNPGFVSYHYEWYKDGIALSPATPSSNTRMASDAGDYEVIVTNNFGCIDTTNIATISHYPTPTKPSITNANPLLNVPSGYNYYQWYRNNAPIIGANSANYVIGSTGYYFVEVTNEFGCTINSDTVHVIKTSKVNEQFATNNLTVYPNPTNGLIKVESVGLVNIKVYNLIGQVISEKKNSDNIDLSMFADGTYILHISNNENEIIGIKKVQKSVQ